MAANRLANEHSPYLLQHAHNPVDWYPWGEEAFEKARREDKPIFLSIGYSTCHWCHVMEHESFENEDIAAILNRDFVPIKVDREERPDVDRIYMTYVQATTGSGGWPMSVWLTPDLKPFFGGTYFPPDNRYGRPGFPVDSGAASRSAWTRAIERASKNRSEQCMEQLRQQSGRAVGNGGWIRTSTRCDTGVPHVPPHRSIRTRRLRRRAQVPAAGGTQFPAALLGSGRGNDEALRHGAR